MLRNTFFQTNRTVLSIAGVARALFSLSLECAGVRGQAIQNSLCTLYFGWARRYIFSRRVSYIIGISNIPRDEVSVFGSNNWLLSLVLRSLRLRLVHADDDVRSSLATDHLGACADSLVTASFRAKSASWGPKRRWRAP
jgi:hypothetical protein